MATPSDKSVTCASPRLGTGGRPLTAPAFYALRPGGWRDYVTLLHLPYTAWHLSYVVVGGCLAATVDWTVLGLTVLAFGLAIWWMARRGREADPAEAPARRSA